MLQPLLDYGGFSISFVEKGPRWELFGGAAEGTHATTKDSASQVRLPAYRSRSSEDGAIAVFILSMQRKKEEKSLDTKLPTEPISLCLVMLQLISSSAALTPMAGCRLSLYVPSRGQGQGEIWMS